MGRTWEALQKNLALLHFKASLTIHTTMYTYYYCHEVYPTIATWENGTDCCSWSGVTCHPISGHVTAIDLACVGLQGKIKTLNLIDEKNQSIALSSLTRNDLQVNVRLKSNMM